MLQEPCEEDAQTAAVMCCKVTSSNIDPCAARFGVRNLLRLNVAGLFLAQTMVKYDQRKHVTIVIADDGPEGRNAWDELAAVIQTALLKEEESAEY